MPPFIAKILGSTKALIALGVVTFMFVAFFGTGLMLFLKFNGVQKDMVAKETALSAQYSDNQNNLSSYISTIKESLGVADRASDALDEVLSDAVKGRYEGDSTANPSGGAMFSAIVEAYPDLNQQQINYQAVQKAIFDGRESYKNQQTRLLDMLRAYETWKESGLIHRQFVSMIGAPSDNLRAGIGDDVVYGQAALDRMYKIVLAGAAKDAYESGEMDPMDLNPDETVSPDPATSPSAEPTTGATTGTE